MGVIPVEISFVDGVLTCVGNVEAKPSEVDSISVQDEGFVVESVREFTLYVNAPGQLITSEGVSEIPPGIYRVSRHGIALFDD